MMVTLHPLASSVDRYFRKGDRTAKLPATCGTEERFSFSSSGLNLSFPPSRFHLLSQICSRGIRDLVVLLIVDQATSVGVV
jgi:hypothetical protein